jgi:hypothetical protein
VDSEEEAVSVLQRTVNLDRRQVRRRFEERFSATRMAEDYVEIYNKLLTQEQRLPQRVSTLRPRVGRDQQRMN